jgi:hypothetical protein
VFYDYAARDLYHYNTETSTKQDSEPYQVLPPIPTWNPQDEFMITDAEEIPDLYKMTE